MPRGAWAREDRREAAAVRARQVLHETGITTVPVDPFLIGTHLGVPLREEHYDGVEGYILRVGSVVGIGINTSIEYEARRRFTMAHELGHCCLPWHSDPQYMCSSDDIDDWKHRAAEQEANVFAAELMMPLSHFQGDVNRLAPSLATFRELAETKYGTSVIATAIRFVRLTDEPVALVLSSADRIVWAIPSGSFPYRTDEFVTSPSENSYAWDFFHGKPLPDKPRKVLVRAWITSRTVPSDVFAIEESFGMPRLARVLSLIGIIPGTDDGELPEVPKE
jgi:hypothetical protein